MNSFICPVCGSPLTEAGKSCVCRNNHSFDFSRSGYINLLMSGQSKLKRHGDDKAMVRARRDFLEKGYYSPLRDAVISALSDLPDNPVILDAGCGECWYTEGTAVALQKKKPEIFGIDISKNALELAKNRSAAIKRAVASVYKIPLADCSCDAVIDIFAPIADSEFARVLKPKGLLVIAVPAEEHLFSLKQAVYDIPYKNPSVNISPTGFKLVNRQYVKSKLCFSSNSDILNLFMMTPYYYKTSRKDFEKLQSINSLDVEAEFVVLVFEKPSIEGVS